MTIGFKGMLS